MWTAKWNIHLSRETLLFNQQVQYEQNTPTVGCEAYSGYFLSDLKQYNYKRNVWYDSIYFVYIQQAYTKPNWLILKEHVSFTICQSWQICSNEPMSSIQVEQLTEEQKSGVYLEAMWHVTAID